MPHFAYITEFRELPGVVPGIDTPQFGCAVVQGQTGTPANNAHTFTLDVETRYVMLVVGQEYPGTPPAPDAPGVARAKFGTFTGLEGALVPPGVPTWFARPGGVTQFSTIDA